MDTDNSNAAARPPPRRPSWGERLRRPETLVPAFAVGLVAITAVATAVMATRSEQPEAVASQANASVGQKAVVKAPPLNPPPNVAAQVQPKNAKGRATSSALGAGPACRNCGVVQMVVAVHGYAQPRASGYQMHILMDDGTMRTIEQRGALAAGSRVIVERDSVRALAQRG